jgi:hypothetical protein
MQETLWTRLAYMHVMSASSTIEFSTCVCERVCVLYTDNRIHVCVRVCVRERECMFVFIVCVCERECA